MFRLKLLAIIALLGGPFMIFMNYKDTTEKTKIDKEGVETKAFVEQATETTRRKGGKSHNVEIAFLVGDSKTPYRKKIDVSKKVYEGLDEEHRELSIKYLKDAPDKLIIVGEPLGNPVLYPVGAAIFLFGIGGIWWFFIRRPHGV